MFQDEDTYFMQTAKCFKIHTEHKNLLEPLLHVVALLSNTVIKVLFSMFIVIRVCLFGIEEPFFVSNHCP